MFERFFHTLQVHWLIYWAAWATFGGYLVGTWVAAILSKRLMLGMVTRWTARSSTSLDDRMVAAAAGPLRFLIYATGLRMALISLGTNIPDLGQRYDFKWAEKLAIAIVILAITRIVSVLARTGLDWYVHDLATKSEGHWDNQLLPVIRRVLSLLLYFIAISIILKNFGQDITALVTTAGVASLAVALAAQDTLSNMIGGFVILVDRPFRVGDIIEFTDGRAGEVIDIGLRSSRIRQFDGNGLVIPNKDLASSRIINYALPTPRSAIRQTLIVAHDTDIEKAKAVLLEVMQSHTEILKDPAPGVWFTKFGQGTLELVAVSWVASYKDKFRITDELNLRILEAFRATGIVIPLPQQDVHLYLPPPADLT